jgi:hypothetical protein
MALLLTYPSLTLAAGSVTYLALIPLSAYRYLAEQRKQGKTVKPQGGKGQTAETPAGADEQVVRLRAKQ